MQSAGGAAAAVVLFAFDPATSAIFPSCPLRVWTGWLCPLCGTLRALHALVHGSLVGALHANAFTTTAVLCAGIASLHDGARPGASSWVATMRRAAFSAAGIAILLAFGALRNIPAMPFSWLAP
jgi:uncharacterized protein DUF2752